MRRWGVVWFACLTGVLMLFALSAARATEPLSMGTGGSLVIDTDGSVRDLTVSPGLTPAIAAIVERSVRSWKFEPILRDGKPIVARTGYSLKLVAAPVDAGYAVRVEDVSFGSPRNIVKLPMGFARDLARLGQNVFVLVALRADKEGKITDAAAIGVQSMDGRPVKHVADYERIVARGVKQWQLDPAHPELGDPDVLSATMVLMVGSGSHDAMSAWRTPTWTDTKPVPWETEKTLKTDGLQEGQLAAVDPRIKLKTDVVGKTL